MKIEELILEYYLESENKQYIYYLYNAENKEEVNHIYFDLVNEIINKCKETKIKFRIIKKTKFFNRKKAGRKWKKQF